MSGLLEKATPLHEDILEIESIPQVERDQIYEEINQAVARVRLHITEDSQIHPLQKGRTFPLILNVVTFSILLVIIALLFVYFGKSNKQIISSSAALNLTENRIISTLREESDRQLSAKESEIAQIQNQMLGLLNEKNILLLETKQELDQLQKELQQNMDNNIEIEEERLEGLNWDRERIDQELNGLRTELQENYSNELLKIIVQEEEKRITREKDFNEEITLLGEKLDRAISEKEELLRANKALEERSLRATPGIREEEKEQYLSLIEDGQRELKSTEESMSRLEDQLDQYRRDSESRLKMLVRIDELYQEFGNIPESELVTSGDSDLLGLLNQKIYIKEALAMDTVRQEYPDIYSKLDLYLEDYGSMMERQGYSRALIEVEAMLSALSSEKSYRPHPVTQEEKELLEIITLDLEQLFQFTSHEE